MMKTKRIIYVFSLMLIMVGAMTSCVKDDDFDLPDTSVNPPDIDGDIISISDVKNMLVQEAGANGLEALDESAQYTFQSTDLYMEGYVVSSDESGNFYQEMVLQDKAENPTAGIKIMLTDNPLFTKFEFGRKVYVQLDGFTVGFSNGVISLGIPTDGSDFLNKAPQAFTQKIIRSEVKDTIVPLEMNINDFDRAHDNLYVRLNDMEFPANLVLGDSPKTYAADSGDQYDAERQLENCDGQTTKLLTSTFSDFKALKLPKRNGAIDAILSKTYNGSAYVLKINYPVDLHFDQERCDGEDPGNPDEPGSASYPFLEDFESLTDYDPISNISGWINQDVTGSGRTWEARSFDSNHYAQLTAYNAGGDVESWMISPGVDLSPANDPVLSFETEDGYYNGDVLSVLVSTDFDGDVTTATWDDVTDQATINSGHADGYGEFIPSGEIDLSAYASQTVYVAFKYEAPSGGATTTYQIDNVAINEAGENPGAGDPGDPGNPGDTPDDPSANATLAFAGADFENWSDFTGGLNSFGLQSYATQGMGTGQDGSNSFDIVTDPSTTDGNDYVFTASATNDLPSSYSRITFYMKGTADKSVSLNVYKTDGSYYSYNLDGVTNSKIITKSENNQYANGTIDTNGDWVLIELDLSDASDLNLTDTSADFFALKIGKNANYDLKFDNFTIE